MLRSLRAAALAATTALVATTLTLGTAAPSGAAPAPAENAAGWLATELTNGLMHNPNFGGFDDYGLTIDAGFAFDAIGTNDAVVRQIRTALAPKVASYTTGVDYGAPGDIFSGASAKALVWAQVSGADAASYGGTNLVAQTADRVSADAPIAGRIEDAGAADYANVIGQAFAARGLTLAGAPKAGSALDFLLKQQCTAGYFRLNFATDKTAAGQGCVDGDATGSAPDSDVTSLTLLQLAALDSTDARVTGAIAKATSWLGSQQRADGSFGGGTSTSSANANSTGLAAWALAGQGRCSDAGRAAGWVQALQVAPGSSPALADEVGAVAYDAEALALAKAAGITDATSDQFRRATSQAAPALSYSLSSTPSLAISGTGGYRRPGSEATLTISGVPAGERVCFAGATFPGERALVAPATGAITATVVLPTVTSAPTYRVTAARSTAEAAVRVLGKLRVPVKAKKKKVSKGDKQVLKVTGLAPGEKVKITVRGKKVAKGTAITNGSFKATFKIIRKLAKPGKAKVVVTGQFADLRRGRTYIRVVR